MQRWLVLGGLLLLIIATRQMVTGFWTEATNGPSTTSKRVARKPADPTKPAEARAAGGSRVPVTVPPEVPDSLLVGWTPKLVARNDKRTELWLEGAATLDATEVMARIGQAGCDKPALVEGSRWEVRCEKMGALSDVVMRAGEGPGKGVLSWATLP